MFGSEKKNTPRISNISIEGLIGQRMSVEGQISFSGGLTIDGKVKGGVIAEGQEALLTLTERGSIAGEIRAPHVVINGTVEGDVVASERIELGAQARVRGNIYYKVLEMTAGAQVNGRMVHEDEPRKQLPKPESSSDE